MQGTYRNLLKHSGIYSLGLVLTRLASFLLLPIYTRYLNPADYGTMAILDLTAAVFGTLIGTGIVSAVNRYHFEAHNEVEQDAIWWTGLTFLGLIATALVTPAWLLRTPLAHLTLGPDYDQGSYFYTLVLLTLDVHIGTINPPTHVDIFFGNEAEQLRSASANFVCRGEARLDRTPLNVTNTFGRKGSLESAAAERIIPPGVGSSPATLLGLIQTLERNANGDVVREYYSLLSNDSVPVPTTFSAP